MRNEIIIEKENFYIYILFDTEDTHLTKEYNK